MSGYGIQKYCAPWYSWFGWLTGVPRDGRSRERSLIFCSRSFRKRTLPWSYRRKHKAALLCLNAECRIKNEEVRPAFTLLLPGPTFLLLPSYFLPSAFCLLTSAFPLALQIVRPAAL